jgi:hypothetical protein
MFMVLKRNKEPGFVLFFVFFRRFRNAPDDSIGLACAKASEGAAHRMYRQTFDNVPRPELAK